MNATKRLTITALTLAALAAGAWAQTQTASNAGPGTPAAAAAPAAPAPIPVTAADVQALKDALAAQQLQIQRLTEQLQRQQAWQQAQQSAVNAADRSDAASTQTQENPPQQIAALGTSLGTPASTPVVQQDNAVSPAPTSQDAQVYDKQMEGPLTLRLKGINITPGGYAEGAFLRRSRALGADLSTPFNSLTMPGASQSQIPEFFGSARQSKISSFVSSHVGGVDLSGYVSADFLSAGVTSNSNQTNSYTLRLRQAWGQAKFDNGWAFLGGQAWSLVTENGRGISPDDDLGRTNDARPKTIDPSYNVGFVFARQDGIRLTKNFGDTVAVAVAVDAPQGTLTTHGNAANYLLGEAGASNSYNTTANYTFNPSPDIIAKVAFDPGFGHYEIFGLIDRFTDRVFPCIENFASTACGSLTAASAAGAYNASKEGGGFGASARWALPGHFTFGVKGFGGDGIGRYGPAGLSDISINADGSLHLIKNLMGLTTLEWHSKKLDIFSYGGAEYAARTFSFDPLANKGAGALVGYGAPTFANTGCYTETAPASGGFSPGTLASCTADSRVVIEGTVGFWYRFYNGPRGKFQFGTQYSYVTRNTWSGIGGDPNGLDNMVFTSFRYYLP
jgi:hypothetical protein